MTGAVAVMASIKAASLPTLVYDLDAATYTGLSAGFNGSSQYFDIASTAAFGFGTADFTIECWWRPTVNQRSDVLDFWSDTGAGSYPVPDLTLVVLPAPLLTYTQMVQEAVVQKSLVQQ